MSDDYREYRGDFPHEMTDAYFEYLELLKKRNKEAADEAEAAAEEAPDAAPDEAMPEEL